MKTHNTFASLLNKIKEHKRKYFKNWWDFVFAWGIPFEQGGFLIAMFVTGGILGMLGIWFGFWLLYILR